MTIDVVAGLKLSVAEEKTAERHYLSRAKTADPVTARLYRHITKEEHIHAQEFTARIRTLAKRPRRS